MAVYGNVWQSMVMYGMVCIVGNVSIACNILYVLYACNAMQCNVMYVYVHIGNDSQWGVYKATFTSLGHLFMGLRWTCSMRTRTA